MRFLISKIFPFFRRISWSLKKILQNFFLVICRNRELWSTRDYCLYRQIADELFLCVWPFYGLALKGLSYFWVKLSLSQSMPKLLVVYTHDDLITTSSVVFFYLNIYKTMEVRIMYNWKYFHWNWINFVAVHISTPTIR